MLSIFGWFCFYFSAKKPIKIARILQNTKKWVLSIIENAPIFAPSKTNKNSNKNSLRKNSWY